MKLEVTKKKDQNVVDDYNEYLNMRKNIRHLSKEVIIYENNRPTPTPNFTNINVDIKYENIIINNSNKNVIKSDKICDIIDNRHELVIPTLKISSLIRDSNLCKDAG